MNQKSDFVSVTDPLEQGLWKKFRDGDLNALSELYSVYFDSLYNYGFKFSRDKTLVEDSIQELFIKLIRNRSNLAIPDSVKSYLFKAFRSCLFDKMEKGKKNLSLDLGEFAGFDLEPHSETLVRNEEAAQRLRKLRSAIEQLTPRQREAIFLKYQEGLSYPEIAGTLNLTQKATYKLIARAIQALRSLSVTAISFLSFFIDHNG